ncbi:MAG: cytidylate kinase-like family protein [Phycisphaerae bacterium]
MTKHVETSPEVARLVERQLQRWELTRQQHASFLESGVERKVRDFICISRDVGSGGAQIGQILADRLGWPFFDRQILQTMAGDDQTRKRLYENLDEHDTSWLHDMLHWTFEGGWRQDDYFHRLGETVLALSRRSQAIFVGRGVDLILPKHQGLRVRVNAPHEFCVHAFAQRLGIAHEQAEMQIRKIEQERAEFLRNHFGKRVTEASRFDLCLNMGRMTQEQAVEVVIGTMRVLRMQGAQN